MMWIAVSVPFWLIGVALTYIGAVGGPVYYLRAEHRKAGSGETDALWGGLLLLAAGGIALVIAAKVAS